MKSPFLFGNTVSEETFTNRKADMTRLSDNLRNHINTILISPRRWGKSSLVRKVADGLQSQRLFKLPAILKFINADNEMQFFSLSILFIVIWALGISMIVLAALIHLPEKIILLIGIVLVAAHNLLEGIHVAGNNLLTFGWSLLHEPNFFTWQDRSFFIGYPVLPWIGVMALGYCLGNLYATSYGADKRKKALLIIGASAIGLFILLRFSNFYGDSFHWRLQKSSFFTFLSFINTSKYPPSLLYILMTLGPAVLFLAFTEKATSTLAKIISVYGRVPMFYYLLHIYLIHLPAMISSELFTPVDWRTWILNQPVWFNEELKGYGFSLAIVYLVWLAVIIGLYPLCKWNDRYKQGHKEKWWLSYL